MSLAVGLGLGVPMVVGGLALSFVRFRRIMRMSSDDRPRKDLILGGLAIVWGLGVGLIASGIHPK